MFVDKIGEHTLTMKIMKILRKLNELLPSLVNKTFRANTKLPMTLLKYITDTPMENLAGDSFLLFINVFDDLDPEKISNKFL